MAGLSTQSVGGGFAQNGMNGASNTKSAQMDMNSFLVMFTTQLKYQDPTNPLESHELAAQLAQFTSVEKLTQINSRLQEQQEYLASINSAQMVGVLGKDVVGSDNTLQLKDGQVSKGSYQVDVPAEVTVKIYDEGGNLIRTMAMGVREAGKHDVGWDGRSDAGETMSAGFYHFDIEALDAEGNLINAAKSISGKASAFRMENGLPFLTLGSATGIKLPISSVVEVREATNA